MNLAEFLLERIAEDEERVYGADSDGEYRIAWLTYRNPDGSMRYTALASDHRDDDWFVTGMHDPQVPANVSVVLDARRVLAECEAKRSVLALHRSGDAWCDYCSHGVVDDRCPTIRALAAVFRDHPDFDPAWSVT